MDRSRALPTSEYSRVPRKAVYQGWGHRQARQDGSRSHNENGREVRKLLQRVVPVKTVRLGRQLKIRVVDESVPGLNEHRPRSRHQAVPLFAREQSAHKEYAGQDEPIDVDEMPAPCDPNGVGISRQRKYWRYVAVVVLRGPNAIF